MACYHRRPSMTTFQANPLGIENEGALRPPGRAFFRVADFVKYGIGAMFAGIVGRLSIARMIRVVSDRRVHDV